MSRLRYSLPDLLRSPTTPQVLRLSDLHEGFATPSIESESVLSDDAVVAGWADAWRHRVRTLTQTSLELIDATNARSDSIRYVETVAETIISMYDGSDKAAKKRSIHTELIQLHRKWDVEKEHLKGKAEQLNRQVESMSKVSEEAIEKANDTIQQYKRQVYSLRKRCNDLEEAKARLSMDNIMLRQDTEASIQASKMSKKLSDPSTQSTPLPDEKSDDIFLQVNQLLESLTNVHLQASREQQASYRDQLTINSLKSKMAQLYEESKQLRGEKDDVLQELESLRSQMNRLRSSHDAMVKENDEVRRRSESLSIRGVDSTTPKAGSRRSGEEGIDFVAQKQLEKATTEGKRLIASLSHDIESKDQIIARLTRQVAELSSRQDEQTPQRRFSIAPHADASLLAGLGDASESGLLEDDLEVTINGGRSSSTLRQSKSAAPNLETQHKFLLSQLRGVPTLFKGLCDEFEKAIENLDGRTPAFNYASFLQRTGLKRDSSISSKWTPSAIIRTDERLTNLRPDCESVEVCFSEFQSLLCDSLKRYATNAQELRDRTRELEAKLSSLKQDMKQSYRSPDHETNSEKDQETTESSEEFSLSRIHARSSSRKALRYEDGFADYALQPKSASIGPGTLGQSELLSKEKELRELRMQLNACKLDIDTLKREKLAMQRELDSARAMSQDKIKAITMDLERIRNQSSEAQVTWDEEATLLRKQLASQRSSLADATEDKVRIESQCQGQKNEIENLKKRIADLTMSLESERKASKKTLDASNNSRDQLQKSCKKLEADLEAKQRDIADLEERLSIYDQEDRQMQVKIQSMTEESNQLRMQLSSVQNALAFQKEQASLNDKQTNLEGTALRRQLQDFNNRLDEQKELVRLRESRIAELEGERDRAKKKLNECQDLLNKANMESTSRVDSLSRDISSLKSEREGLQTKIQHLTGDITQKQDEMLEQDRALQELKSELQRIKSSHNNMEDRLKKEILNAKDKDHQTSETARNLDRLKVEMSALQGKYQESCSMVTQLEQKLSAAEGELQLAKKERLRSQQSMQDDMDEKLNRLQDKVTEFEKAIQEKDERVRELSAELNRKKASVMDAFNERDALRRECEFIKKSMEELKLSYDASIAAQAKLEHALDQSRSEHHRETLSLQEKNIQLERDLQSAQSVSSRTKKDLESLKHRHSDLSDKHTSLKADAKTLQERLTDALLKLELSEKRNAQIESDLQDLSRKHHDLEISAQTRDVDYQKAQSSLHEKTKALSELENSASQLKVSNKRYKEELKQVKSELKEIESTRESLLKEVREKLEFIESDSKKKLEQLEQRNQELQESKVFFEKKSEELAMQVRDLEIKLTETSAIQSSMQTQLHEKMKSLSDLRLAHRESTNALEALEAEIRKYKAQLSDANRVIDEESQALSLVQGQFKECVTELEDLNKRYGDLEVFNKKLLAQMDSLLQEKEVDRERLSELVKEITTKRKDVETLKQMVDIEKRKRSESGNIVEKLENDLRTAKHEASRLQKQYEDRLNSQAHSEKLLREEIQNLRSEVDHLRYVKEGAISSESHVQEELSSLRTQLASAECARDLLVAQLKDKKSELRKCRAQIQERDIDIQTLQARLSEAKQQHGSSSNGPQTTSQQLLDQYFPGSRSRREVSPTRAELSPDEHEGPSRMTKSGRLVHENVEKGIKGASTRVSAPAKQSNTPNPSDPKRQLLTDTEVDQLRRELVHKNLELQQSQLALERLIGHQVTSTMLADTSLQKSSKSLTPPKKLDESSDLLAFGRSSAESISSALLPRSTSSVAQKPIPASVAGDLAEWEQQLRSNRSRMDSYKSHISEAEKWRKALQEECELTEKQLSTLRQQNA